jgi:NCS1 family nucleobase:cation symporter-1
MISFRAGGVLTCLIGVAMQPWRLLASYVSGWLVGYSGLLGPVAGILICDYFVRRRRILVPEDLYRRGGAYEFSSGVNWRAILALLAGAAVAFVGLVYKPLRPVYDYAWFVGFGVSFVAYWALMAGREIPKKSERLPA